MKKGIIMLMVVANWRMGAFEEADESACWDFCNTNTSSASSLLRYDETRGKFLCQCFDRDEQPTISKYF